MPVDVIRAVLTAHSSTPCAAVSRIEVSVRARRSGEMLLAYTLSAVMSSLRVADRGASVRADELWRHTCFEAFVATGLGAQDRVGAASYLELNFSPATEWAAYRFDNYRAGMRPAELATPPQITVSREPGELRLTAAVDLASALQLTEGARLHIALATVIEDRSGRLSYWALRHGADRPDFHHPDAFALEIQT